MDPRNEKPKISTPRRGEPIGHDRCGILSELSILQNSSYSTYQDRRTGLLKSPFDSRAFENTSRCHVSTYLPAAVLIGALVLMHTDSIGSSFTFQSSWSDLLNKVLQMLQSRQSIRQKRVREDQATLLTNAHSR